MKQPSTSEPDPFAPLKQGITWMWSLGDYTALALLLEPYARQLAIDAGVGPGMKVLDVAAGNGNFALAAAARGAGVVACDLTPAMIELGRERTRMAGFDIEWRQADAEALPFAGSEFDVVGSVFGAMFAPRPDRVTAELFRVCRPGGLVAMANYSDSGFLGAFAGLLSRYSRPSPVDFPSPFAWGDEGEIRRRFEGVASSVEMRPGLITFRFDSLEAGLGFWERSNPPLVALRSMLPPEKYVDVMHETRDLMASLNAGSDGLVLESNYLTVLARNSFVARPTQTA